MVEKISQMEPSRRYETKNLPIPPQKIVTLKEKLLTDRKNSLEWIMADHVNSSFQLSSGHI